MHTVMNRKVTPEDFADGVSYEVICEINWLINEGDFSAVKASLPEGFLQRRIVCTNYKTLANMYQQRKHHKLDEWRVFLGTLLNDLEQAALISDCGRGA